MSIKPATGASARPVLRVAAARLRKAAPRRRDPRGAGSLVAGNTVPTRELSAREEQVLIKVALGAWERAYAPESGFHVGAALLGQSGEVYGGYNIENASYGFCMCAERTAIYAALLSGETAFEGLVVVTASPTAVYPCAGCRQVLAQFCGNIPVRVVFAGGMVRTRLAELVPHIAFEVPRGGRPRAGRAKAR